MRNIVVPVDFSPRAKSALKAARRLAEANRCMVHVVHVMELPPGHTDGCALEEEERRCYVQLNEIVANLEGVPSRKVVLRGPVIPEIARYAAAVEADMIVLGDGMRNSSHVTEALVHRCDCPVVALRSKELAQGS